MCMYVCVFMYVLYMYCLCMYVCGFMFVYVCVCVCVCMYVCMCVFMYVCLYVCMHVCMYVCMYVFFNMWFIACSITAVILQAFTFLAVVLYTSCTILHYYVQLCYQLYIPFIIAYNFDLNLQVFTFLRFFLHIVLI